MTFRTGRDSRGDLNLPAGEARTTRARWIAASTLILILETSFSAQPGLPVQPARAVAATPALRAQSAQRKPRLFPPEDLGLLEAPDRDDWNKPELIMDILGVPDGAVVADLGAGGGWFTVRLSLRVGPNGIVYAEDIQPQMIEAIDRRLQHEGVTNVRTVMGTSTDPRLPPGLDAALIVDAYREMDEPARPEVIRTLLTNVAAALKPQGRLAVVDFLPGGGGPGPAAEDRVDPEAVIAAANAAGFTLLKRENVPPFQFILVFGKAGPAAPRLETPH